MTIFRAFEDAPGFFSEETGRRVHGPLGVRPLGGASGCQPLGVRNRFSDKNGS